MSKKSHGHDQAPPRRADKIEPAAAPTEAKASGAWMDKRVVAGVAGLAVGSAAVAAALLFAGRSSKPKSAAFPPPPPPTPSAPAAPKPAVPDASAIAVAKAD